MALTDLQRRFIDEYMIDMNGTQAVLRCGSMCKDAHSASSRAYALLTNTDIREEIDRRIAERRSQNRLTVEKIEGMLRDMAEVEPLDIWDEKGNVRKLQDMPPHARRAIKSIKKKTRENLITGVEETEVIVELWDKKGAVELLGKFNKMFTDKLEVDANLKKVVHFTIKGIE